MHRESAVSGVVLLVPIGFLGVLVPLQLGAFFFDGYLGPLLVSFVGLVSETVAVADAVAGERERRTLETLLASRLPDDAILFGKLAASVLSAVVFSAVTMAAAHVAGNLSLGLRQGAFVTFSAWGWVAALLLPLFAGLLVAALGVHVSLYASSVKQAQQILALPLMLVFLLPAALQALLPREALQRLLDCLLHTPAPTLLSAGLLAILLADVALVAWARHRFRRTRLVVA